MSLPELPVDVAKGDVVRTASTPAEYWGLHFAGFTVEANEENLSPQQKAARTRAAHKAEDQKPDTNPDAQAGNASA